MLRDRQLSAPHDGAEPLDQPRFPDDQAVSLRRAGKRAIAADEADSLRQAQRRTYDEPVRLGVQEHERAKVAPTGKIEAGDMTGEHRRNFQLTDHHLQGAICLKPAPPELTVARYLSQSRNPAGTCYRRPQANRSSTSTSMGRPAPPSNWRRTSSHTTCRTSAGVPRTL